MFKGPPEPDGISLVCTIVRSGAASVCQVGEPDPRSLTIRWYPGGGCAWRITNIYGSVEHGERPTLHTAALARDALAEAEARLGIPGLICGDFNRTWDELPCAYAFACADWADLHSAPTCSMSAVPRRIDLLLANVEARRRLRAVRHSWEAGFYPHAAQWIELTAGAIPAISPPKGRIRRPRRRARPQ